MKKILIIGRQNAGEKNDVSQLADAIGNDTDRLVVAVHYEDFVVVSGRDGSEVLIGSGGNVKRLSDFDTVVLINWSHHRLYTDLAHSIAYVAEKLGMEIWNRELLQARSSTKVSQVVRLSYEHVPFPKTIFSLTPSLIEEYIDKLGTSFVAKDPLASRGRRNYLCTTWLDFKEKSAQDSDTTYVFQEFIPNDSSDIRMFVAGKEPALAILRKGSGASHLNNVSQGASAELLAFDTLPSELLEVTRKVACHFERDLCGIDFMKNTDTDEYVFLEINTTPQIINGVFAEEKVAAIRQALTRN